MTSRANKLLQKELEKAITDLDDVHTSANTLNVCKSRIRLRM